MIDDILNDTPERRDYLSYLLRLWRVGGDGGTHREEEAVWRASLESPHTGERRGFASLHELFAFLEAEVSLDPLPSRTDEKGDAIDS
jgi:hypothetical protein